MRERLDSHDNNRKEVQDKLRSMCDEWRKEIDGLEDRINSELETKFTEEDSRLQATLSSLQTAVSSSEEAKITEALQKARQNSLCSRGTTSTKREIRAEVMGHEALVHNNMHNLFTSLCTNLMQHKVQKAQTSSLKGLS